MNKLIIVQCGDRKIWKDHTELGKIPAKDAYTSPYFKKHRAYAERFGDRWVILSAKYGFLNPDETIEDYNVSFKRKKSGPISFSELKEQVVDKGLNHFDEVVVLGGKEYLEATQKAFEDTQSNVLSPFEDLKIGIRMSKINEALQN